MRNKSMMRLLLASIAQFSINSLPLFNTLHSINFWFLLSGRQIPQVLFNTFLAFSFLGPIAMTAFCFYFDLFAPGALSCWISKDYMWARYALYYGPLFVDNVVGLVFIVWGIAKVCHFEKGSLKITHKKHIASAFKGSLYGALFVVILISYCIF